MLIDVKLGKLIPHLAKPAVVLKICVQPGAAVKAGDTLLEVEAGKGATAVKAEATGKIAEIPVAVGDAVTVDQVLARLDGAKAPSDAAGGGFNYFGNLMKPQKQQIDADITIIGGGPGGYVAAIRAAQQGAAVVLVEKDALGGTCLNRGCIPTKAFVRSAQVYNTVRQAGQFGVVTGPASVDMAKVVAQKNRVVGQLTSGIKYLLSKHGVKLVDDIGRMLDANTVFAAGSSCETTIKTKNIIIATGSRPARIPIPGADLDCVLDSDAALDITAVPRSIVIVGGGVIGMEFAYVFANFGAKVAVVEYFDKCLTNCDDEIVAENARNAAAKGISLYTGAKVERLVRTESGECLVCFSQGGTAKYLAAEKVLMAVGRQPYTDGLGLENIGVALNDNGRGIKVDGAMRTSVANIYAIGDVTNKMPLAHVASHQGIVAADNIMGRACQMDYTVVPAAIFTDPEIATVGISEHAARAAGQDVAVGRFPYAANGKAMTFGETGGFIKLIQDKASGRLIGGSIIGMHATDLIGEITLAIKYNLTAAQVSDAIHAHPTTAEIIPEAALAVTGVAIHCVG